MNDSLVRFQSLLRELFQLDFADLDFGLYRLFRLRAKEVEGFIEQEIPKLVDEAFGRVGGEQAEGMRSRLEDLRSKIKDELEQEAFAADGSLLPEVDQQKHGKTVRGLLDDYKAAIAESQSAAVSEDRKVEVFNHLYAFFSRYYDNADFIPMPRYGRSETYAVPYSGEEVAFHWATKGMHYIKSATHFRDYRFSVDGSDGQPARVHFRITDANLPTNNTKGDTRYFFPLPEAVDYDTGANTLTVPFHYRLPTAEEAAALGNKNVQAKILEQAVPELLGRIQGVALHLYAVLANPASQADETPLLTKRLVHFTRRANQDYFIHPDLGGFLSRELEFYLKDVVLSLEDVTGDLKGKLATIQVIRKVGEKIIGFLHQVESAQNRLFEKPKFVLATDWLVPIRFVPETFWPEILANAAQTVAWTGLFGIPAAPDSAFLKTHPTLVLDTRHFDGAFKRRLMEALPFESLHEAEGFYRDFTVPVRLHDPLPEKLYVPQIRSGLDLQAETWVLASEPSIHILLDRRPKVTYAATSQLASGGAALAIREGEGGSTRVSLAADSPWRGLLDESRLYIAMLEHKRAKRYGNLYTTPEAVREILERCEILYSSEADVNRRRLQQDVEAAIKTYADRFYAFRERQAESLHLEPAELNLHSKPGVDLLLGSYAVRATDAAKAAAIENLLSNAAFRTDEVGALPRLHYDRHLYDPLLCEVEGVGISPAPLNPGEASLVRDLRDFWRDHHDMEPYRGLELYLLRNLPKVGVGFFVRSGCYPDFILWVRNTETGGVRVVFLEPHGMREETAGVECDLIKAMGELRKLSDAKAFKSKGIELRGFVLTRTKQEDIRGAEGLDRDALADKFNLLLLRQSASSDSLEDRKWWVPYALDG